MNKHSEEWNTVEEMLMDDCVFLVRKIRYNLDCIFEAAEEIDHIEDILTRTTDVVRRIELLAAEAVQVATLKRNQEYYYNNIDEMRREGCDPDEFLGKITRFASTRKTMGSK